MRNNIAAFMLLLAAFLVPSGASDVPPSCQITADRVINGIAQCRFDQAEALADSMIGADSVEPLGFLLRMSVIALRNLDYNGPPDAPGFEAARVQCLLALDRCERKWGRTSHLLALKGLARAVEAACEMHRKKYIAAMRLGFDAVSLSREAGAMDKENADVDFVLGFYGYARAEMRKKSLGVLFWYPKDNGIRLLERCAEKGRIASLAAAMLLPDIYIREGMYDKASAAIARLEARYPRGRFSLWARARLCDAQKNYLGEARAYLSLADAYAAIPQARRNCLQTLLYAARGFRPAGEKDKARDACLRAISLCTAADGDFLKSAEKLLRNR